MPYATTDEFISRPTAVKKYGRSKSSFIRDVEDAFGVDDAAFLEHFKVYLNDGTVIDGPKATKDVIQKVQDKQPRWMISVAFLETRYWEEGTDAPGEPVEKTKPSAPRQSAKPRRATTDSIDDDIVSLRHQLELAQQELRYNEETIDSLKRDKKWFEEELETRRSDMKDLKELFSSVGDAADSTAKLKSGSASQPVSEGAQQPDTSSSRPHSDEVIDVPSASTPAATNDTRDEESASWKERYHQWGTRHTPTLHKILHHKLW